MTPSDLAPSLHTSPPATVPPANMASKTCLVASYGGDSDDSGDDEDGALDESRLVDWTKLACLLCKRQFQSRDILAKHNQFSDLHKVGRCHVGDLFVCAEAWFGCLSRSSAAYFIFGGWLVCTPEWCVCVSWWGFLLRRLCVGQCRLFSPW